MSDIQVNVDDIDQNDPAIGDAPVADSTDATDLDVADLVAGAMAADPEANLPARLVRGQLESEVFEVTNRFVSGEYVLPEGKPFLTAQLIAGEIQKVRSANGVDRREPSTGAIADTLKRWDKIGFASIQLQAPLAFLGYTEDGYAFGLLALKERFWASAAEGRAAARAEKAAAKKAAAPATEAPVEEVPVEVVEESTDDSNIVYGDFASSDAVGETVEPDYNG